MIWSLTKPQLRNCSLLTSSTFSSTFCIIMDGFLIEKLNAMCSELCQVLIVQAFYAEFWINLKQIACITSFFNCSLYRKMCSITY